MTSTYKTDFGNGVIIYADDYVKTGQWYFDCTYSRLISRTPPPSPAVNTEDPKTFTIGEMHSLTPSDREQAKIAIRETLREENWHKKLRYTYSGLNTYSTLNVHIFDLLIKHNGKVWVLKVRHWLDSKNMPSIEITAEPYSPDTYVDYEKAIQMAAKSCPKPL